MIVVDTNIIAYLLIPGNHSESVTKLYQKDPSWAAPALWRDEFINVLCTCLRTGKLTYESCLQLIESAESLMKDNSFFMPSARVLEVARQTGCSGYDSQFIALAEDLDCRLFTYDSKILERCPGLSQSP